MSAARAPYAVEPAEFRFPALAAAAGRAPLGGERETALAAFLTARLAHDALNDLPAALRTQRAAAARSWLSSMALSATARRAFVRLLEASEADDESLRDAVAAALQGVTSITANLLAPSAQLELEQLGTSLRQRESGV